MAFQLNGLDPSNSGSGGASLLGTYRTNDAIAAVLGVGYFNEAAPNLRWTHMLLVRASDAVSLITVASDGDTVTTAEYSPGGGSTITWDDIEDKPEFGPQLPATDGVQNGYVPKKQSDGSISWSVDGPTVMPLAEMTTGTASAARAINATGFPALLGAALARNTAIAALTPASTLEDVIAALQAG